MILILAIHYIANWHLDKERAKLLGFIILKVALLM